MNNNYEVFDACTNEVPDSKRILPDHIENVIAKLRIVIDELDKRTTTAKSLILDLAKQLDDTGQLKQNKICKKIKDLLRDKIKERKITGKWIEKCLPQKYKQKYTKSELCSLSQNSNKLKEDVVHNYRKSLLESSPYNCSNTDNFTHSPQTQVNDTNQILEKERTNKLNDDVSCIRCRELEEALRNASKMTSAEYLSTTETKFAIPRERYDDVKSAMDISSNCCYLIFDANTRMLLRSESD